MMGTATAGIAFLPVYSDIGVAAIVLLSILRFAQGLALGGSWDGLPSLLALNAPQNRRGWYAMIPQLGAPLGFMLAAALFAFLYASLKEADFYDWGWRYPFYVAFAINVEFGRASCRERVCQYGEISVVSGSIKKKN